VNDEDKIRTQVKKSRHQRQRQFLVASAQATITREEVDGRGARQHGHVLDEHRVCSARQTHRSVMTAAIQRPPPATAGTGGDVAERASSCSRVGEHRQTSERAAAGADDRHNPALSDRRSSAV